VSFTYDAAYGRLAAMVDGIGTTSYTYRAPGLLGAGAVEAVVGPVTNDTLTYGYDELGRVVSRTLNGVTSTWAFDALCSLTRVAPDGRRCDRERPPVNAGR
jgi:YD repeat-containing protein